MKKFVLPCADTLNTATLGQVNSPWRKALHLAKQRICPAHAPMLLSPEEMLDFYFLDSGLLRVMHCAADGRQRSILYIGPDNLFNEASAITGYDAPDCCFYCLEKCVVYRFPGAILHDRDFLRDNPDLILNVMLGQASKILLMHAGMSLGSGSDALVKVSRFFLGHVKKNANALAFDLGMTQDELATLLGIHRATMVRVISELKKRGVLSAFTKRRVQICDLESLRQLAGD